MQIHASIGTPMIDTAFFSENITETMKTVGKRIIKLNVGLGATNQYIQLSMLL
jgi:hypothetical protein